MTGMVSEIVNFSTMDGPGIRTTVFLMGCPLRCKWCSNPETFVKKRQLYYIARRCMRCGKCEAICPRSAISSRHAYPTRIDRKKCDLCFQCVSACMHKAFRISGTEYDLEELVKIVERDKVFYGAEGGLTVSGGEPLSQGEFTRELFRLCKERGISTVLDTTAHGDPETLAEILRYTDLVLLDIKHMNPHAHRQWTGVSNEGILENARRIAATTPVRISIPLIAGVNDSPENIRDTARFALENGIRQIDLAPIHFLGAGKYKYLGKRQPYGPFRPLEKEEVTAVQALFRGYGLQAEVGRMM